MCARERVRMGVCACVYVMESSSASAHDGVCGYARKKCNSFFFVFGFS